MSEGQYQMQEYVVAFIDVLGATEKIKKDAYASLNIVHEVYNKALESHRNLYKNEYFVGVEPTVRIFSDNIVISVPTADRGVKDALMSVLLFVALVQIDFLGYGYLMRGGIAVGEYFVDDTMLWGKALLDAHQIEDSIAIYPRVVIHPKLMDRIEKSSFPLKEWLKLDTDGLFYLNYLKPAIEKVDDFVPSMVTGYMRNALSMFEESKENIKVNQKIRWHLLYLEKIGLEVQKKYDGGAEDA